MTVTAAEVSQMLRIVGVVSDVIKELGTVPEGVLYAHVAQYMSLATLQSILGILIEAGKVRRDGHVLHWIG